MASLFTDKEIRFRKMTNHGQIHTVRDRRGTPNISFQNVRNQVSLRVDNIKTVAWLESKGAVELNKQT